MFPISAATSTKDIQLWEPAGQITHLLAKFNRITFFQVAQLTKHSVVKSQTRQRY